MKLQRGADGKLRRTSDGKVKAHDPASTELCCCGSPNIPGEFKKIRRCFDGEETDYYLSVTGLTLPFYFQSGFEVGEGGVLACYYIDPGDATAEEAHPDLIHPPVDPLDELDGCFDGPCGCDACDPVTGTPDIIKVTFDGVTLCPCFESEVGFSRAFTGSLGSYCLNRKQTLTDCTWEVSTDDVTYNTYATEDCTGDPVPCLSGFHAIITLGRTIDDPFADPITYKWSLGVTIGANVIFSGFVVTTNDCLSTEVIESLLDVDDCGDEIPHVGYGGEATIEPLDIADPGDCDACPGDCGVSNECCGNEYNGTASYLGLDCADVITITTNHGFSGSIFDDGRFPLSQSPNGCEWTGGVDEEWSGSLTCEDTADGRRWRLNIQTFNPEIGDGQVEWEARISHCAPTGVGEWAPMLWIPVGTGTADNPSPQINGVEENNDCPTLCDECCDTIEVSFFTLSLANSFDGQTFELTRNGCEWVYDDETVSITIECVGAIWRLTAEAHALPDDGVLVLTDASTTSCPGQCIGVPTEDWTPDNAGAKPEINHVFTFSDCPP